MKKRTDRCAACPFFRRALPGDDTQEWKKKWNIAPKQMHNYILFVILQLKETKIYAHCSLTC